MQRIALKDLVGVDVAGRQAITTSPEYYYQYPQGVPIRTLVGVFKTARKDHTGKHWIWYTVRWEREPGDTCDFSGYREDSERPVTVEFLDPITLLQLASAILGRKAENGADFEEADVAMWGGCEVCGASIAAYNGCPSRTGYIRCANACIGDQGFATVEECRAFLASNVEDEPI